MAKRVAVVGAGIAGLTAAHSLKSRGHSVTVFESSDRVGGRMTTDLVDDCLVDRGAQILCSSYSTILPLVHQVGLASELCDASAVAGIVRSRRMRRVSTDHPSSVLTSGWLTPREILRCLPRLLRMRRELLRLPLDDYSAWAGFDDEEAAACIRRDFGAGLLEHVVEPYLQGLFYQSPAASSKAFVFMLLSLMMQSVRVITLRGGMGSLPERLASSLDVKLKCPILALRTSESTGVTLTSSVGTFSADNVVIATTASMAGSIYGQADDIARRLMQTPYSSTIVVAVATEPPWQLPASLQGVLTILTSRSERTRIGAIGIQSQKGRRVSAGESFYVTLDGEQGSLLRVADDELVTMILPELEIYLPGVSRAIRLTHVVRWDEAVPKSPVGRSANVKRYRETLRSSARVVLAGDYMGFPHTDSAASTGKWAAEFLTR